MADFSVDMTAFKGIEDAKETFERNYLPPGIYSLEISAIKYDKARKGYWFFAVDFVVRGSNVAEIKLGEHRNFFTGADKDGFLSNVKNFSIAALSEGGERIAPETITEEVIKELIRDSGEIVRGRLVTCSVTAVPTKGGGTYNRHVFGPGGASAQSA